MLATLSQDDGPGPCRGAEMGAGSGVEPWGGLWPLVFSCWIVLPSTSQALGQLVQVP